MNGQINKFIDNKIFQKNFIDKKCKNREIKQEINRINGKYRIVLKKDSLVAFPGLYNTKHLFPIQQNIYYV